MEQGLNTGEFEITLRQWRRRCGGPTGARQEARICALPQPALAEALLAVQGADGLAWLAAG